MVEVTKGCMCSDKNSRANTNLYLWVSEQGKDGKQYKKVIGIDVDDAMKMTDDTKRYTLNEQTQAIIPKRIRKFDIYISSFISAVYDATDLISNEEYLEYCLKRLECFQRYIHSKKAICEQFFDRYMPRSVKEKYQNVWDMIKSYETAIQKEVAPHYVLKGGRFLGCYTDYYGRRRPITERKYYEKWFNYVDELKVCIKEELCYA